MIDLTPLDVRNKRGDFRKVLRGYDPQEVDVFLEIVSDRLEELVRENIQLRERSESLQQQVTSQTGRENAVHEALVTAQELRSDMRSQAQREADLLLAEAQAEVRRRFAQAEDGVRVRAQDTERRLAMAQQLIEELERRRSRFLKSFRQLLEREMDVVQVELERPPLEERAIDMDLGGKHHLEEAPLFAPFSDASPRGILAGDDVDGSPPLDMPVDQLAAAYSEAEAESNRSGSAPHKSNPPAVADQFAPPATPPRSRDEDGKWG